MALFIWTNESLSPPSYKLGCKGEFGLSAYGLGCIAYNHPPPLPKFSALHG